MATNNDPQHSFVSPVQVDALTEAEMKDLYHVLLKKTSVPLLKTLYKEIGELLSFDIVSQLPFELSEEIFSYLDEVSLCAAAQCCKHWRIVANNNKTWLRLCIKKDYTKYKDLSVSQDQRSHSTSSQCKMFDITSIPTITLKPPMCQWKEVFIKGKVLEGNWRRGIYTVAPLLRGHREPITGLCLKDKDNKVLVSSSRDGTVCLWNLETLELMKTLQKHSDEINSLSITKDYIITGCADGAVRVFDSASGQLLWLLNEGGGSVELLVCNDLYIVSANENYSLHVWKFKSSLKKPQLTTTLQGHTSSITCIVLNDDTLASGSWDSSLRVWDCAKGLCNHIVLAHMEGISCICFNEAGQLVSGGGDSIVRLWNTLLGNNLLEMKGHTQEITYVKCQDDVIVSASADSSIRVWNYKGFTVHKLENHLGLVRCLWLSAGDRFVSGGDRKRICIWDLKTGKLLHEVYRQQTLLHIMIVTDTMIITGAPDSGTISIIKYW